MGSFSVCITAVVMTLCIGSAFSCSCFPVHPQQHFCTSDFVIKAKVLGSFVQGATRVYKVVVIAKYKCLAGVSLVPGSVQYINTPLDGAACGAFLEIGQNYVLSGNYDYRGLNINFCGFNRLCSSLTPCQLFYLKFGIYAANCNCQVTSCLSGSPCPKPKCGCLIIPGSNDSVCVKYYGQCFWTRFC